MGKILQSVLSFTYMVNTLLYLFNLGLTQVKLRWLWRSVSQKFLERNFNSWRQQQCEYCKQEMTEVAFSKWPCSAHPDTVLWGFPIHVNLHQKSVRLGSCTPITGSSYKTVPSAWPAAVVMMATRIFWLNRFIWIYSHTRIDSLTLSNRFIWFYSFSQSTLVSDSFNLINSFRKVDWFMVSLCFFSNKFNKLLYLARYCYTFLCRGHLWCDIIMVHVLKHAKTNYAPNVVKQ